jgi:hypothetical protein
LDEFTLAGDRVGLRLDVLRGSRVALLPLPVIRGVVAPERGQTAVAELPDPRHRRVEERAVVRGDEERSPPTTHVLLRPFQRRDIEVVCRLVEEEEVRIGDDEASERRPRLLAPGKRGRRLRPLVASEPEARQRLIDALVQRVPAENLEFVLEPGVALVLDTSFPLERGERLGHRVEVGGSLANGRAKIRRSHERVVEMRLLGEQAERQAALAVDGPTIGLVATGGKPQERRLAGAVRANQADPVTKGDRGRDRIEDDERSDLAVDGVQTEDRHQSAADRRPSRRPTRRSGSAGPLRPRRPDRGFAGEIRPTRPASRRRRCRLQDRRRTGPISSGQPLAPRAEVGCPPADDDSPDRPTAARTWLASPLVDLEMLLHVTIAVGRGVVVDRGATPDDRLGQDAAKLHPQPALVGGPERRGRPQRVQPRCPQRFVGVDVADARDERLVEEERLQSPLPRPKAAAERADRQLVRQRLWPYRGERVVGRDVEPDPAELANVPKADLAAILEREDKADVRVVWPSLWHDEELTGHLQVDRQERSAGKVDHELLAAPADGLDPAAGHTVGERLQTEVAERPSPARLGIDDRRANDEPAQVAGNGFDLGQLRHERG